MMPNRPSPDTRRGASRLKKTSQIEVRVTRVVCSAWLGFCLLGIALFTRLAAHSKPPRAELYPATNNGEAEHRIAYSKDPGRRFIIDQSLKPMRDERAAIGRVASSLAKRHLQCGQWTDNSEPRLNYDEPDADKMQNSKPRISNPVPAAESAKEDQ